MISLSEEDLLLGMASLKHGRGKIEGRVGGGAQEIRFDRIYKLR